MPTSDLILDTNSPKAVLHRADKGTAIEFYENTVIKRYVAKAETISKSEQHRRFRNEVSAYLRFDQLKCEFVPRLLKYSDEDMWLQISRIEGESLFQLLQDRSCSIVVPSVVQQLNAIQKWLRKNNIPDLGHNLKDCILASDGKLYLVDFESYSNQAHKCSKLFESILVDIFDRLFVGIHRRIRTSSSLWRLTFAFWANVPLMATYLFFKVIFSREKKKKEFLQNSLDHAIGLRQSAKRRTLSLDIKNHISASSLSEETLLYLEEIIAVYRPKRVIEFGSGLSSLHLSRCLQNIEGSQLWAVEDSKSYYESTLNLLVGQDNTRILLSPISSYSFGRKDFLCYDARYLNGFSKDQTFDLVLIDGPLGHRYGREAVLYQIAPYLHSKSLILLDDANRSREQAALKAWRRVWGNRFDFRVMSDMKKGLAVLKIIDPSKTKYSNLIGRAL